MVLIRSIIMASVSLILLTSCASERKVSKEKVAQKGSLDARFNSNYSYNKETGRVESDSRSQFESRTAHTASRDFKGQDFMTESYSKKRWAGDTKYKKQSYEGNTDGSKYQYSPHFVQQQARAQGQAAMAAGQQYGGQRGYTTKESRLNSSKRIEKNTSAQVENQSSVNNDVKIINYSDYGKLNVQQTNSLLGR